MRTARTLPYGGLPDRDTLPGTETTLDRDIPWTETHLDTDPLDRDKSPGLIKVPWTETPRQKPPWRRDPPWIENPLDRDLSGQRPPGQRPTCEQNGTQV